MFRLSQKLYQAEYQSLRIMTQSISGIPLTPIRDPVTLWVPESPKTNLKKLLKSYLSSNFFGQLTNELKIQNCKLAHYYMRVMWEPQGMPYHWTCACHYCLGYSVFSLSQCEIYLRCLSVGSNSTRMTFASLCLFVYGLAITGTLTRDHQLLRFDALG